MYIDSFYNSNLSIIRMNSKSQSILEALRNAYNLLANANTLLTNRISL